MSRVVEISCDGCGRDIAYTGNSEDYYLVLGYDAKSPWYLKEGLRGGVVTDMAIAPPLDRQHHFCDLICMDHWSNRRRHLESLWRDWHKRWEAENGTDYGDGDGSRLCPVPAEDIRRNRQAEFETAALAAFPMDRAAARAGARKGGDD